MDDQDKDKERVVDLMQWLKDDLARKKPTDEEMIKNKDEVQDMLWIFHNHIRDHNYGLLHKAIHEALDLFECKQPPENE